MDTDKIDEAWPNPWHPMTEPIDLKHLGKLTEEACELGSAASRCMIQGIDEIEPLTKKLNRDWLTDEIADVLAGIELTIQHFKLDTHAIDLRKSRKQRMLENWHKGA